METLVIKVDKKENVPFLRKLLKKLNFVVEIVEQETDPAKSTISDFPVEEASSKPSISDFAGIWQNREITLEELREKSWKRS